MTNWTFSQKDPTPQTSDISFPNTWPLRWQKKLRNSAGHFFLLEIPNGEAWDRLLRSRFLRITSGPQLYKFQSKPNQNIKSKPHFFTPKFHIKWNNFILFSFGSGFQFFLFMKIWPKCTRNLLNSEHCLTRMLFKSI